VIKKPQNRRPRPDLGCRAIGWMDGWMKLKCKLNKYKHKPDKKIRETNVWHYNCNL
jgi:hypothetical protein